MVCTRNVRTTELVELGFDYVTEIWSEVVSETRPKVGRVHEMVGSVRFELTNSYAPGTNLTKLDHDPEPNSRHNTHSKKVTKSVFL